ncbi:MAG TPA: EAL domain-containing protein [Burkholderiaceae bacterium]|nr:EAL domain-containing protein [Burkholderiaceae bacterium]
MPLKAKEKNLPRLHLFGTGLVLLVVTLSLAAFFSWQGVREQTAAFERVEQAIAAQQEARLTAEMTSAMGYLDFTRSRAENLLRQSMVDRVDGAMQMVEALYAREVGKRPPQEVKQLIIEALRPMRFFDGRGYFFVDGMDGQFILLPTAPHLEGKNGINNRDDTGHYIMKGLIEAAGKPQGEGFSRYRWYRPDRPKEMSDKLAYVRHFAPFDWLIGTGDYTYEWEEMQKKEAMARLRALRFGESGRVGLLDRDGRSLLSPSDPTLEGRSLGDMPERERATLARLQAVAMQGGGLVRYDWVNPKTGQLSPKTALLRTYEPWGWVLVVTVFDDDVRGALAEQRRLLEDGSAAHTLQWAAALLGALALGLACSWVFSRWLAGVLKAYQAERERTEVDLRIAAIAFETQEGMTVTDAHSVILRVNRAFTRVTGYEAEEVIGKTPSILASGRHDKAFYAAMRQALSDDGHWAGEVWNRRKNGEVFPEWLTITAVKNREGEVTHYVSTLTDITQRKAAEDEIRSLAFFDPLTRLPNRRLLMDRLQQALVTCHRSGRSGALMFIDLDNFKIVNDTMGHDKGDELLCEVARRLTAAVREGDTVARLGGDEFVIMLEELSPLPEEAGAHCRLVGEKLLYELSRPHLLAGQEVDSSCSLGIALFSDQQHSADELMKHADLAMYQAKAGGRNALRFFDPNMQAAIMARLAGEKDLRHAIRDGQLRLYFQAQYNLAGRMTGAEALVRWQHPLRGMVSPAEFIPLAEDTGLILPLGQWVLEAACQQLALWAAQPATAERVLAVNVSGRQLRQADFVAWVLDTLARTGAPPGRLKLELTESLLLDNKEDTIQKMTALKVHGVGFSLDDFGTGYSSLAYLKRLPLDQLKIDQSFVHDVTDDPKDAAIVRAIVALADSLGLNVIAEGVETAAQRDALAGHGCLHYQGYLYGRPGLTAELPA